MGTCPEAASRSVRAPNLAWPQQAQTQCGQCQSPSGTAGSPAQPGCSTPGQLSQHSKSPCKCPSSQPFLVCAITFSKI